MHAGGIENMKSGMIMSILDLDEKNDNQQRWYILTNHILIQHYIA